MKRSLYQCSYAKVLNDGIYCAKGKILHPTSTNGHIHIRHLIKGKPLELRICQDCLDYDCMGPPVPAGERGWYKK